MSYYLKHLDPQFPGEIQWQWNENPLGTSIWPGDNSFKGPRTQPTVGLAIDYKHNDIHLRHAVRHKGTLESITEPEKQEMKELLIDWLYDQTHKSGQ